MEIKKTTAIITRHGDKVETIFSEMQKRFSGFEKYADNLKDLDKNLKSLTADLDSMKTRLSNSADKKDMEDLVIKFDNFQKHINSVLTLANRKADNFEKEVNTKLKEKLDKVEKMLSGFEVLAQKTPDLNKYFNLLEKSALPQEPVVENLKSPGKEEKPEEPEEEDEEKKSLFSKLKEKIPKLGGKEEGE